MTRTLLALALALWAGAVLLDAGDRWVERTELPPILLETSVEVRDRHGALLRAYPVGDGLWRLPVRVEQVDPGYIAMLLRYEDKRFYRHSGVDPLALGRAVGQALWNKRTVSGGSTLTMQVARLIEDGPTGRWQGKIRQIRVALALERQLTKDKILELYLTHAPFGGNLEGVRAASLAWFGKEPARLTEAQAALLVALPQSPETRRPDRAREAARSSRNRVLARMEAQGVLEADIAQQAQAAAVPGSMRPFPRLAAHLADEVVETHPDVARLDLTIDADMQRHMEEIVSEAARKAGPRISAALVVADHHNGEILASVGSPGYGALQGRQGFVDMTRALRSPGSTLKPLVYGLAFDRGLAHPETIIHDGPVQYGTYAPRNFDGEFRGDVRVREALQLSLNIPVVKLTEELGPARLMVALRRSGAELRLSGGAPGLALALGGVGVSLRDLVQLYAGLARGGQAVSLRHAPMTQQSGDARLMSRAAAWHVADILRDVAPPRGAPMGRLAWKSGTSYGHRDAWAVGFDGSHVVGVWMGRADGTPVPGAFGARTAAPVLFEAFGRLKPEFDLLPPPPPETLIVSSAELPQPLRRFRTRDGAFSTQEGPEFAFPPNGARVDVEEGGLPVKIRGGEAPFTVLKDGAPVVTRMRDRQVSVDVDGAGFVSIVVIDRNGQRGRVVVRVE